MIFVDTGPFLARHIAADTHHREAVSHWERIARDGETVATSNFVLDEAITLLVRRAGYTFAAERADNIYASKALAIFRPDREDELDAVRLFRKCADQRVSFTDCTSFVLMRRNRITRVFTFDVHFSLQGFTLVPQSR